MSQDIKKQINPSYIINGESLVQVAKAASITIVSVFFLTTIRGCSLDEHNEKIEIAKAKEKTEQVRFKEISDLLKAGYNANEITCSFIDPKLLTDIEEARLDKIDDQIKRGRDIHSVSKAFQATEKSAIERLCTKANPSLQVHNHELN